MSIGVPFEGAPTAAASTYFLEPGHDDIGPFLSVQQVVEALRSGRDKFYLPADGKPADTAVFSLADQRIVIDPVEHFVLVEDKEVALKAREFDLLAFLAMKANVVRSRRSIYTHVWRDSTIHPTDPRLNVRIKDLRHQLGGELGNPLTGAIRTITKVGYKGVSSLKT